LRKRYVILAAAVALTLVGAPTLAYATTGTEAGLSLDKQNTQTNTQITPTSLATEKATGEQTTLPAATESPDSTESPVESPQPTATSDSGPTTTPESSSGTQPAVSSPPASPTPTAKASTAPEEYVLAVWRNEAGSPKFPQYLVASYLTTSTNVKVLEEHAQLCGTFYQSDLYANDARTQALIAKGVLNGGDESWPLDAYGNMIQRYDTLTTHPCEPTPTPTPTDEPTEPEATPSPSTPEVSPTSPTSDSPTASPTIPTPTQAGQPSESPVATSPSTEQRAVSLTGDRPLVKTGTSSSLAYTGSDNGPLVGIAVLAIFVGALAVVLAKNRKRK